MQPDNKFDLISIVLQVPLGYQSERQVEKEEGGRAGCRRCSVNKKLTQKWDIGGGSRDQREVGWGAVVLNRNCKESGAKWRRLVPWP